MSQPLSLTAKEWPDSPKLLSLDGQASGFVPNCTRVQYLGLETRGRLNLLWRHMPEATILRGAMATPFSESNHSVEQGTVYTWVILTVKVVKAQQLPAAKDTCEAVSAWVCCKAVCSGQFVHDVPCKLKHGQAELHFQWLEGLGCIELNSFFLVCWWGR